MLHSTHMWTIVLTIVSYSQQYFILPGTINHIYDSYFWYHSDSLLVDSLFVLVGIALVS